MENFMNKRNIITLSCGLALFSLTSHANQPIQVPAGNFQMGCSIDDDLCDQNEGPAGGTTVNVPTFSIDSHEVTVADYKACMKKGRCLPPLDFKRNKYCNLDAKDRLDHPINCIDWSMAVTYCESKGGRLPNEAEWEKAARASTTSRYPWGQTTSCKEAILDEVSPEKAKREPDGCEKDTSWPVASRPANALGLYDMHGNIGEWTSVWYGKEGLSDYASGKLNGPETGKKRVARGGSWDENKPNLRSSFRNLKFPEQGGSIYGSIGFRCAYDK